MPGSVPLLKGLIDREHLFLTSFRVDFLRRSTVFNDDLKNLPYTGLLCAPWRNPAPRSKHTVQQVAESCGTALVYCVGSRTARHSGLSGSCSLIETAARSPDTCGTAGISAARSLSPPSGVFTASRSSPCSPGERPCPASAGPSLG